MTTQKAVSLNASRILSTVGVPPKEQWHGVYLASCYQNNDPLNQSRIKMLIPQVLGTAVSNWARPLGYNAISIPSVGQMVHAYFAGGDVNNPVYISINISTINSEISTLQSQVSSLQTSVNAITPGSWQSLTLQNGWSNAAGYLPAQVRLINTTTAQLVGTINGGTTTDNTTIATLPSGYYNPSGAQIVPVFASAGANGVSVAGSISGTTDTDGIANGQIAGTSGQVNGGSAGSSNHTHSPGSYAVTSGQHNHTLASMGVTTPVNYNTPVFNISSSGVVTVFNLYSSVSSISFNVNLVV